MYIEKPYKYELTRVMRQINTHTHRQTALITTWCPVAAINVNKNHVKQRENYTKNKPLQPKQAGNFQSRHQHLQE